jgi:hypothetical protein
MPEYLVKWEIDIDADSPQQAAAQALAIQRDRHAIATVFDVHEKLAGSVPTEPVRVDVATIAGAERGPGHAPNAIGRDEEQDDDQALLPDGSRCDWDDRLRTVNARRVRRTREGLTPRFNVIGTVHLVAGLDIVVEADNAADAQARAIRWAEARPWDGDIQEVCINTVEAPENDRKTDLAAAGGRNPR